MAWTINNLFPSWGDSGEQPSSGYNYMGGEQVYAKHFNYLWDGLAVLQDEVRSALEDIDSDGDGVVDEADYAAQADTAGDVDTVDGTEASELKKETLPPLSEVGDATAERSKKALQRIFDDSAWTEYYRGSITHGQSTDFHGAYRGAAVGSDGNVYLAPCEASNIGIYDPKNNTFSTGPAHNEGEDAYEGVVSLGDKIVFIPYDASSVMVYDIPSGTVSKASVGTGSEKFSGGAATPNGKVVMASYSASNIGIYNPETNTYTSGPAHGQDTPAFDGAVLVPDGRVIFIPYNSDNIGIYDPETETYTDGPPHGLGFGSKYRRGALSPDGRVIMTPWDADAVGIFDPSDDSFTTGTNVPSGEPFVGATVAPDGRIVFAPFRSSVFGLYDPQTDTYEDGPTVPDAVDRHSVGITMAENGVLVASPKDSTTVPTLRIAGEIPNWSKNGTHPLVQ